MGWKFMNQLLLLNGLLALKSGKPVYEFSNLADQVCAVTGAYLVKLQSVLVESQQPGQLAHLLKHLGCAAAAKLIVAFLCCASHQHHSIGALLQGLED
jgi:hypothetical protein